MAEWQKVADESEIPAGGRLSVIVDEVPALLLRAGDAFYCIEDTCTHDGQPLTDGPFDGRAVTCPRHGAKFEVSTGRPLCMPATEGVRAFEVERRGNEVFVRVPG